MAPALLALLATACTQNQPARTGSGGSQVTSPTPASGGGSSLGARSTVEQNPDTPRGVNDGGGSR